MVDAENANGLTPLHSAVRNQNKELVESLINAGASINEQARGSYSNTPLHFAAEVVNLELINYLLDRGADVHIINGLDETPVHSLLFKNLNRDESLLLDALEVLLSANEDINAPVFYGRTLLDQIIGNNKFFEAARGRGNPGTSISLLFKILKIFLKHGADFTIVNPADDRPLDIFLDRCIYYDHWDFNIKNAIAQLESFIEYSNIDFDLLFTPTMINRACSTLNYDVVKFLVEWGADTEALDENLCTPLIKIINKLIYSSISEDYKVLAYFLSLNPNLNIITGRGLNILNSDQLFEDRYYSELLWKMLIEHIAKRQSTGYVLHEEIQETISQDLEYRTYLEECTQELRSLLEIQFPSSWVKISNLLLDDKEKLVSYAENKILVKYFNDLHLDQKYPIYGPSIVKRFSRAIRKQEVLEKSAAILSSCLPHHLDPDHIVIKKIISYIELKHLKDLCDEPTSEPEAKKLKKAEE